MEGGSLLGRRSRPCRHHHHQQRLQSNTFFSLSLSLSHITWKKRKEKPTPTHTTEALFTHSYKAHMRLRSLSLSLSLSLSAPLPRPLHSLPFARTRHPHHHRPHHISPLVPTSARQPKPETQPQLAPKAEAIDRGTARLCCCFKPDAGRGRSPPHAQH